MDESPGAHIIFDQDGHDVAPASDVRADAPGDPTPSYRVDPHGVPAGSDDDVALITTTPMDRKDPANRFAHAVPRPTRRERRARRKEKIRQRRTFAGRHPKTMVAVVVILLLSPLWYSLGSAATDPALGNTAGARLTEWVRDHGGGGLVTWAENTWYTWHAPPKGGKPAKGAIPAPVASSTTTVPSGPAHLAAPAAIVPFASPPTAGEGQWHPIGPTVDGIPTMYAAYLRPNAVNTSLVTGVAWMDTKLLEPTLYAGSMIPSPGPTWANQAPIAGAALTTLAAAFNSGFRMPDSNGGFYLNGVTSAGYPLRNGAASFVIMKDGSSTVGVWGRDVSMSPEVEAVRQNLDLIVDNGAPVAGLPANDNYQWGATLGGKVQVWRSGLGVTADGALVYVGGSGLSIVDLANLLTRAGAVRAMEMDINTAWVNFFSFDQPAGQPASGATGTKLTYDESNDPYRYFSPSSRDFITMSVRPVTTPSTTSSTAKGH
jgi:hypothetical protein